MRERRRLDNGWTDVVSIVSKNSCTYGHLVINGILHSINGVLLVLITGLTGKGPQLWMVYGKLYLEMDDNWGYPQFRIPHMVGNL